MSIGEGRNVKDAEINTGLVLVWMFLLRFGSFLPTLKILNVVHFIYFK